MFLESVCGGITSHVHTLLACSRGGGRTGHDREDLLHELQVVDLVELRRELAALERLADLEQQAEPRVRDVALQARKRGSQASRPLQFSGLDDSAFTD